jgi:hypothetical protein
VRLPLVGGRLGTPGGAGGDDPARLGRATVHRAHPRRRGDCALLPDGDLLLASETEPSIRRFAPDGRQRAQFPVPPRFLAGPTGEATENQAFESLALAPDGRTSTQATEGPLAPDGFATPLRARLRLLRYADGPAFVATAQYFYLAETAQGLSDIVALGPDELLTLERGFIPASATPCGSSASRSPGPPT